MIVLLAEDRARCACSISSRGSPVAASASSQVIVRACSAKCLETDGVVADEVPVEHGAGRGVLRLQQQPVQHLEQGQVPAGTDLQELVGDRRTAADHAARMLRVLEADQTGLGQGVDRDDLPAVALGLLQRGEHARVVGAGVLPDHEDQVCRVDIVERHAALADAQRLLQREAAGLVAHVGAVGQVVGAERAGEQLQQERGLVVEPPGGVEERFVGRAQPEQLPREQAA